MNVMYSGDGAGHWWRREWKLQCPKKVFFSGQCQGVEGHQDVHWCFGLDGSFKWQDKEAGSTPPGHRKYRTPKEMRQHYYLTHYDDTEVVDPDVIMMLENSQTPEKDAAINQPYTGQDD